MADFTSIVNGWPFADITELRKRIELAEAYAASHPMSDRQKRVLEAMKKAATDKARGDAPHLAR